PGTIGDGYDRSFKRDIARAAGACCVDIAARHDGNRVVGLQINVDAVRADAGRKTIVAPGTIWQGTADIEIIGVDQQRTVAAVLGTQIEAEAPEPRRAAAQFQKSTITLAATDAAERCSVENRERIACDDIHPACSTRGAGAV